MMNANKSQLHETIGLIRSVCTSYNIVAPRIILFGSRARNDFREDSDYDFIVICDKLPTHTQKMEIWLKISRLLSEKNRTADIIFKTEEEFQNDIRDTGKISYYANREGVVV